MQSNTGIFGLGHRIAARDRGTAVGGMSAPVTGGHT